MLKKRKLVDNLKLARRKYSKGTEFYAPRGAAWRVSSGEFEYSSKKGKKSWIYDVSNGYYVYRNNEWAKVRKINK